MIKKRCKTPVNYSSVEMINFNFNAQDPIQEPILDQDIGVTVLGILRGTKYVIVSRTEHLQFF